MIDGCDRGRRIDRPVVPRRVRLDVRGAAVRRRGSTRAATRAVYAWGPFRKTPTAGRRRGRRLDALQLHRLRGTLGVRRVPRRRRRRWPSIGKDRDGCGRALWENNEDNGQYGTTMALMLLPHWTDGCIASMEGLFFEASGTTPYHFLTAAAMSQQSSSTRCASCATTNNDASVGVPVHADARRPLPDGPHRGGQGPGRRATTELTTGRQRRAVGHLPGRRQPDIVEPLTVQPVVVEPALRRPARAQSRARHELVPAPGRVGGDAGRRRARRLAAHRRRGRRWRRDVGEPGDRSRNVDYRRARRADRRRRPPGGHGVSDVEIGEQDRSASTSTRSACRCSSR